MPQKFSNYPTCHCHPQSLDSASTPEAFAKKEVELGSGGLTCTDHGSLGATYKIYELAKKHNLIAAPGIEAYFREDECSILNSLGIPKTDKVPKGSDSVKWKQEHPSGTYFEYNKYYHITLGLRDFAAYKTAVRLLSKADARAEKHGSERKALFGWDQIEELAAQNITAGSGCLVGMVGRHLASNNELVDRDTKIKAATAYFDRLHSLFKDRFYIEVFPHVCSYDFVSGVLIDIEKDGIKETLRYYLGKTVKTNEGSIITDKLAEEWPSGKHKELVGVCNYRVWTDFPTPYKILNVTKQDGFVQNECAPWAPNGDMQFGVNAFMLEMAKKYKIPVLISDDSHFCDPKQKIVQDVKLAQGDEWEDEKIKKSSWRFYESYHRKSSDEAFEHFKKYHDISEAEFESWINNSKEWLEGFKGFKFETKPQLPEKFFPKDSLEYTKQLINRHGRMPKNDPIYLERLKKELAVLNDNGKIDLLKYLWIDEEICRVYQNQGKLTSLGRGSAAGCLVAYLLGITHIDPIKYDLPFERFLTLDRINSSKLADIDQDLPDRDLLVGYDTQVIEFEAEDGTKHIVPKDFKVETKEGLLTVQECLDKNIDFEAWWFNEG